MGNSARPETREILDCSLGVAEQEVDSGLEEGNKDKRITKIIIRTIRTSIRIRIRIRILTA